jgi:hypothetical protein
MTQALSRVAAYLAASVVMLRTRAPEDVAHARELWDALHPDERATVAECPPELPEVVP